MSSVRVSIIIKSLNEQDHIAACIESAIAALEGHDGDVILADSGSTDRTIEIASRYPIRVVQIANPSERSCGIGPQLGFEASSGDFICLIDGDMVLAPGFLDDALGFLAQHSDFAGVAGRVRDVQLESLEYVRRNRRHSPELASGETDRLNGGGLFRRAAIESVGYFTDRNLHSYEEFDLGARLKAAGWRLQRLERPFVDHHGHRTEAYGLLWRRLTTRYAFGIGEVVRAAIGRPHIARALRLPELRLWSVVTAVWICVLGVGIVWGPALGLLGALLAVGGPVALMSWRYRSLRLGAYAATAWLVHAIGLVGGLLRPRVDPTTPVAARVLHDATGERVAQRAHASDAASKMVR